MTRVVMLAVAATLLASSPTARAAPVENERVPLSFMSFSSCPVAGGEPVRFEGFMHIANNFTTDAAGGFREHFHANLLLKGVGLVSGDRYVSTSVDNLTESHPSGAVSVVVVSVTRHNQIRAGEATPDDDLSLRMMFTIPGGVFVEQGECR
jgi:hypothetical protein